MKNNTTPELPNIMGYFVRMVLNKLSKKDLKSHSIDDLKLLEKRALHPLVLIVLVLSCLFLLSFILDLLFMINDFKQWFFSFDENEAFLYLNLIMAPFALVIIFLVQGYKTSVVTEIEYVMRELNYIRYDIRALLDMDTLTILNDGKIDRNIVIDCCNYVLPGLNIPSAYFFEKDARQKLKVKILDYEKSIPPVMHEELIERCILLLRELTKYIRTSRKSSTFDYLEPFKRFFGVQGKLVDPRNVYGGYYLKNNI